jgi:hypothetical protein
VPRLVVAFGMVSISLMGTHVQKAPLQQTIPWGRFVIGTMAVSMTEVLTLF